MLSYSALIAVYDKENPIFLKESLESILIQSVLPKQVVLVEDGKLNPSLEEIILQFKKKFDEKKIEFNIVKNDVNKGLGPCLNQGMDFCSETLAARFDSDDISKDDRMKETLLYFKNNSDISVVGGYIAEFSNNPDTILGYRRVPTSYTEIKNFSKKRNPMNHVSVTFRTADIKAVGGYDDVPGFEDYYLWLKLIKFNYKLINIPKVMVAVRVGNNFEQRRRGINYIKKEYFFEKKIYRENMISFKRYLLNMSIRTLVRLFPTRLVSVFYKFIRNR